VVGGQVRLVQRFALHGRHSTDWDERFGVIGDIGNVVQIHDTYLHVQWPNGSDPEFRSSVDRDCVEAV
jgi:hypothetical protein